MAGETKDLSFNVNLTAPTYTPTWSASSAQQPATQQPNTQQNTTAASETQNPTEQQQGAVNNNEGQAGYQKKNPDFYNNQNIINLNSSRYRGLGKRRRLRNDLRALGQDAVVWNGAKMQMASNFSNGQQFNRRNAMDMIRNGRQNAGMYSENNFKAGSVEADANKRVHDYFSQNQNASRAKWDHGSWEKPMETPVSQSFQNMLQQYQGGYTPGAFTSYAQQLFSNFGPANTQVSQTANTQTSTQSAQQQPVRTYQAQQRTSSFTPLYNWEYGDLSNWQQLIGVDSDGKFGKNTMAKFNDLFGNSWKQVYTKDGSAIQAMDGTTYFNNGRFMNADGTKGTWRNDGTQIFDKRTTSQRINPSNFNVDISNDFLNNISKSTQNGKLNSFIFDRTFRAYFDDAYKKRFGEQSIGSNEYLKARNRNRDKFLNDHNMRLYGNHYIFS